MYDRNLARQLAAGGRRTIQESLDIRVKAREIEAVMDEALEHRRRIRKEDAVDATQGHA